MNQKVPTEVLQYLNSLEPGFFPFELFQSITRLTVPPDTLCRDRSGEHFGVVNIAALKSAQLCSVSGDRASKSFTYSVVQDSYPVVK